MVGARPVENRGTWFVEVELSDAGLDGLNGLAEACFAMDPAVCPLGQAAIVVDGEVVSTPTFASPSFDTATIAIDRDEGLAEREALGLAAVLASGPLPVPLELQSVDRS